MALDLGLITKLRTSTAERDPSSPTSSSNREITFSEYPPRLSNKSQVSMSAFGLPKDIGPSIPQDYGSPLNSGRASTPSTIGRASTPSTITPMKSRMTANAGSDGDDEQSPTVARLMQIPRKSVGSGSSKTPINKDSLQAQEGSSSGGDGTLRGLFRKKDGKGKEPARNSAKGKAAEQDEAGKELVASKVS